ncbi:MAG: hypothetical protein WC222_01780 [Parachlamydiales bacterium]|jgi:hypothetical protein
MFRLCRWTPLLRNLSYFLACLISFPHFITSKEIPRTVLALYDSQFQDRLIFLNIHQMAEMPLNHLGLRVEYVDIHKGLPDIAERSDVIGILTWFPYSATTSDPEAFINWSVKVIDAGLKYVVMGNPGFDRKGSITSKRLTNVFWEKLGLEDKDISFTDTYDTSISYSDPVWFNFERNFDTLRPPYSVMKMIGSGDAQTHLTIKKNDSHQSTSELVVTSPNGAYAASNYLAFKQNLVEQGDTIRKWYVNPFKFFEKGFITAALPKLDATTLAGRRIYYSHIDGDGWNNMTEVEKYRKDKVFSSEVFYKEILLGYPDLPITIAPIAADMSLKWFGTPEARNMAKRMFELPHVEIGCHTFTHPFDWSFFRDYLPQYEVPYLNNYTTKVFQNRDVVDVIKDSLFRTKKKYYDEIPLVNEEEGFKKLPHVLDPGYVIPRAYALKPFNVELETVGAIKEIQTLAPAGKKVMIYQWSGNCQPFDEAIRLVDSTHVRNINGGDTRFDAYADSYGWVKPLGLYRNGLLQVYSSNANENIYTDMWSKNFYGFNLLPKTFARTESPIRVKPMNHYYHIYSAEKQPSLSALHENLKYIRAQEIIPLHTSNFSSIVDGFYSGRIFQEEDGGWSVKDRKSLQTVRLDYATFLGVDLQKSTGVIGQRHYQGSLYIYLDEAIEEPKIYIKDIQVSYEEPVEPEAYLIHSHWRIWDLKRDEKVLKMQSQGFGKGDMVWKVPVDGEYTIKVSSLDKAITSVAARGVIQFFVDADAIEPITMTISRNSGL